MYGNNISQKKKNIFKTNIISTKRNILKIMEYGNDSDSGARHCIGFTEPQNSIKNRSSTKGASNDLCRNSSESQEFSVSSNHSFRSSSNTELLRTLRDQSICRTTDTQRAAGSPNDSFFSMLQDYQPAILGVIGTDQRSPGPAEFMQGRAIHATPSLNKETELHANRTDSNNLNMKKARDPKAKNKLQRFLIQSKNKTDDNVTEQLGLSLLTQKCSISEASQHYSTTASRTFMSLANMEEQQRQRVFAHYDCQSLAANLSCVRKQGALSIAKVPMNTIGSSAASAKIPKATMHVLENIDSNELLENCPNFCSEICMEDEREYSLSGSYSSRRNGLPPRTTHRPVISYSVSILESSPGETLWRVGACPFQNDACLIEAVDHGAHYYRRHFYSQKHENWFGIDEKLGPLAISIKKEKLHDSGNGQRHQQAHYQFRMIIRTAELSTLRGLVLEDSILNPRGSGKSVSSKELLEYVAPEIQINCLRLGVNTSNCEEQLLKLDEQGLTSKYKVGILYCRSGQSSEEDMYNNEDAGPAFTEFLETIGKRVRLRGFQQYKAGLDNKTDSTGTYSVHAVYKDCEVMFHVCTMLPFTPNNRQQLLRKRHIGNDIVTIIFQEPGALPFKPKNIRSQFQHVFLIIRAINPCTDNTAYRVAISRSKEVPVFGPPLPAGALFSRNKTFAEFVLAKIINAENAAHRSEKFANLATRTRKEYLKDLCINYCTNLYIDPGNKFSIFPSKKKEKPKIRFFGDTSQRGAICWQIILQNHGSSTAVECFLGISVETFVIVEEYSKQIIFVTPTRSILGWSTSDNSLRIFYHNGECITFNMRYFGGMDEQQEVIERLRAVTLENGVIELSIKRNMLGQLGFHVQPDGIVTQVDTTGQAWAAGLRRGYRLVEVCKIVVASLSYGELIDLLKTSAQLTFIVIKSFSDSTPRSGCFNKHCKLNFLSLENEQESYRTNNSFLGMDNWNVKSLLQNETVHKSQNPVLNCKYCYEQHSLPHKPTSRSGYQTGNSSLSPNELNEDYKKSLRASNSCSLHSGNNDKWYETLKDRQQKQSTQNITLSLHHQYTFKTFDHPKLEESASLPLNLNTSLLLNKAQTSNKSNLTRQSLLSNVEFSMGKQQSDPYKRVKHRCSNYEITELKCVTISPSESCTPDFSMRNHNESLNTANIFEEKTAVKVINSTPTYECSISNVKKIDLRGPVLPCSSTVKTARLLPSVTNFNPMKNIQRNMGNYSTTKTFRQNLLEIISPNCSSHYESLIPDKNSTVERVAGPQMLENVSDFITSDLKQPGMQQTFEGGSDSVQISFTSSQPARILSQKNTDDNYKSFRQHNALVSGSSSRLQEAKDVSRANSRNDLPSRLQEAKDVSRANSRNDLPVMPPLMPDTKELDWTTLVDTATKAIISQFRDEKHCKPLSLYNNIDDIKNDTGSNLQETSDSFPMQYNCASDLKSHLTDLENRILRETHCHKTLESTILRLSDKNPSLQDESKAALQQLKSYTDWFYQTNDRKS